MSGLPNNKERQSNRQLINSFSEFTEYLNGNNDLENATISPLERAYANILLKYLAPKLIEKKPEIVFDADSSQLGYSIKEDVPGKNGEKKIRFIPLKLLEDNAKQIIESNSSSQEVSLEITNLLLELKLQLEKAKQNPEKYNEPIEVATIGDEPTMPFSPVHNVKHTTVDELENEAKEKAFVDMGVTMEQINPGLNDTQPILSELPGFGYAVYIDASDEHNPVLYTYKDGVRQNLDDAAMAKFQEVMQSGVDNAVLPELNVNDFGSVLDASQFESHANNIKNSASSLKETIPGIEELPSIDVNMPPIEVPDINQINIEEESNGELDIDKQIQLSAEEAKAAKKNNGSKKSKGSKKENMDIIPVSKGNKLSRIPNPLALARRSKGEGAIVRQRGSRVSSGEGFSRRKLLFGGGAVLTTGFLAHFMNPLGLPRAVERFVGEHTPLHDVKKERESKQILVVDDTPFEKFDSKIETKNENLKKVIDEILSNDKFIYVNEAVSAKNEKIDTVLMDTALLKSYVNKVAEALGFTPTTFIAFREFLNQANLAPKIEWQTYRHSGSASANQTAEAIVVLGTGANFNKDTGIPTSGVEQKILTEAKNQFGTVSLIQGISVVLDIPAKFGLNLEIGDPTSYIISQLLVSKRLKAEKIINDNAKKRSEGENAGRTNYKKPADKQTVVAVTGYVGAAGENADLFNSFIGLEPVRSITTIVSSPSAAGGNMLEPLYKGMNNLTDESIKNDCLWAMEKVSTPSDGWDDSGKITLYYSSNSKEGATDARNNGAFDYVSKQKPIEVIGKDSKPVNLPDRITRVIDSGIFFK